MLRLIITVSLSILLLSATPSYWRQVGSVAAQSTGCQYVIAPVAQSFASRGGSGSFSILSASNCAWTVISNAPWINLTSANSGSGLGRINYSIIANPDAIVR